MSEKYVFISSGLSRSMTSYCYAQMMTESSVHSAPGIWSYGVQNRYARNSRRGRLL